MNFNDMTKTEQRVAVAKDIICQLLAKKYYGMENAYVGGVKRCNVCAIGAAIVSRFRLCDGLSVKQAHNKAVHLAYDDPDDLYGEIDKTFHPNDVAMMEFAFEGILIRPDEKLSEKQEDHCLIFHYRLLDRPRTNLTKRLLAIFANIVKHNGRFVPEDVYFEHNFDDKVFARIGFDCPACTDQQAQKLIEGNNVIATEHLLMGASNAIL